MKVLVTAASKHGSTSEIAAAIGDLLQERGADVLVIPPEAVEDVADYDAVVLGSAIYAGRWRKSANEFVARNISQLSKREVWLFSSGPLGDPPKPAEELADAASIIDATRPQEHRVFAGKLNRGKLNFGERALVKGVGADYGDFRDWVEIRQWASHIADELQLIGEEAQVR